MQPLNPFLRAFFASRLPSQCSPPSHHVLLVPTTEFLLSAKDTESNSPFTELVQLDDFLSSHVLRIPGGADPFANGKEWPNLRESKAKAKQYTTLNGRTVIIKDVFVYSNKGFKSLNQAQFLHDEVYYSDAPETPQWLIYYISKPLLGSPEPREKTSGSTTDQTAADSKGKGPASSTAPETKREVNSFHELLSAFPMIARQMQPGLERLSRQFVESIEQPVTENSVSSSVTTLKDPSEENLATSPSELPSGQLTPVATSVSESTAVSDGNTSLKSAFETLVLSAIDIFQSVDKQQLSMVGDITNLSGPIVERMIEKYMVEGVHEKHLFPKICASTEDPDLNLEGNLRHMADVDISQVGIGDYGGAEGKRALLKRLSAGVEAFQKMNNAKSPREMIDILLNTERCMTAAVPENTADNSADPNAEKKASIASMNADVLVSLLLMVVVRSSVRHLHARLSYMRDFVVFGDVESGQTGYALSTLEAVLIYLSENSGALRKIGRTNRALWHAVSKGSIKDVRAVLDPDGLDDSDTELEEKPHGQGFSSNNRTSDLAEGIGSMYFANGTISQEPEIGGGPQDITSRRQDLHSELDGRNEEGNPPPKAKKRVSMDIRSLSSSVSDYSFPSSHSRSSTVSSIRTIINGETTAAQLSQTQEPSGNSILMMAVEKLQPAMLSYLLQLSHIILPSQVLEDRTVDGTTLLSAAAQIGDRTIVGILLDYLLDHADDDDTLQAYIHSQDTWGRSIAHYCFNVPYLIPSIGHLFPWKQKDKNGQTPLFAMCRSYDHEDYRGLVESALKTASKSEVNGQPLNCDDHVDGKGNSLLHVVTDSKILRALLFECNSDINAYNDKHFTPLMVNSKFARTESIRVLFNDSRVDMQARDLRGLTAVELAKDDEVRNRIDDLVLLQADPMKAERITTIVRSFFVEDGTVRMVIKSGAANGTESITVTTCRRSLGDFENLARWLSEEHPASWMPSISNLRSPFQITPKPSKQVIRDMQLRLDEFLQTLLKHPTFATHEMLWEFFLVPDIDQKMLAERARRKAEIRVENLAEEYDPLTSSSDISEVEIFTGHAIDQVRQVQQALRSVLRRVNAFRNTASDLAEAHRLLSSDMSALPSLARPHATALHRYALSLRQREHPPHAALHHTLTGATGGTGALLAALARPTSLIGSIHAQRATAERHRASAQRSQRWPSALGLLDDTRSRLRSDADGRADKAAAEMAALGRELAYTRATVAGELAGWQQQHARGLRDALRRFAQANVVIEKDRLQSMRRAVRGLDA